MFAKETRYMMIHNIKRTSKIYENIIITLVKFECAFIRPKVLTAVGGPGYYPGHESCIYIILKRSPSPKGPRPVTTPNRNFKMAISRLKKGIGHLDPRHLDPRHLDPRHLDPRHLDPRHLDPRHLDPRYHSI